MARRFLLVCSAVVLTLLALPARKSEADCVYICEIKLNRCFNYCAEFPYDCDENDCWNDFDACVADCNPGA